MPFRFQSEKVHLTYKTHLDMNEVKTMLKSKGAVKLYSIVHENGDEEEEAATPYAHTHVFAWWMKRLNLTDERTFDIGDVHPNIKTMRSMKWAEHVCMKYHHGHKVKADGKKYFIAPVLLEQEGVDEWKFNDEVWDAVQAAPSLKDACDYAGVKPKSMSDLKTIRAEGRKRPFEEVEADCDKEWIEPPANWDRTKKSLIVAGKPGIGKTNWAVAQFEKPFCLSQVEDLKHIPDGCDGLVFDDMELARMSAQNQKKITDVRRATSVYSRNVNSHKPKLPAIFTTNDLTKCLDMHIDDGAVGVRTMVWNCHANMYK